MKNRSIVTIAGALVLVCLFAGMLASDLRAVPRPGPIAKEGGLVGRVKSQKPWKAYVMPWKTSYARVAREGPPGFFLARPLASGVYRVVLTIEPDPGEEKGEAKRDPSSSATRTHTLVLPVPLPKGIAMDAEPGASVRESIQGFLDRFKAAYLAKDVDGLMGFYSEGYTNAWGDILKAKMAGLRQEFERVDIRSLEIKLERLIGTDERPFLIVSIDLEGVYPANPRASEISRKPVALELGRDPGSGEWKIQSSVPLPVPPFEERWVKDYVYLVNSPLAAVSVEPGKLTTIPGVVDLTKAESE